MIQYPNPMNENDSSDILNIDGTPYRTRLSSRFLNRKPYAPADPKIITGFIPGTVLDILVSQGQDVKEGDELMILDAMKMQNMLLSPVTGTIGEIFVARGDKVSKGSILIRMA